MLRPSWPADPYYNKAMCGADLVGSIRRSDFGVKYGVPLVSDEVKLFIAVEGYRE